MQRYLIRYHFAMEMQSVIHHVMDERGWSLRRLALEVGTSHSTLSAYAHRRVEPAVGTLGRIVASAGLAIEPTVVRRITTSDRGRELLDVLDLAAMFPARHSPHLTAPVFPCSREPNARS